MARPRIFISSTYFDLRVVRADIERFLREIGYEPVLFERGHVPYGKEEALEEYCYREIVNCDIIVTIIGGKYGTQSKDQQSSITHKELKAALDAGKHIYVFVEKSVHSEYRTYLNNKDVKDFKPTSVNDVRIFRFLEEIYSLPGGNPVEAFEISEDITRYLREQWAGLFQRLMQESSREKELNTIESLQSTATTLNSLVTFLTEERSKGDQAIKDILLSSHPAFAALKKITKIPYRVIFQSLSELDALLKARTYIMEMDFDTENEWYEWLHEKLGKIIKVSKSIFDADGRLKIFTPQQWKDDYIQEAVVPPKKEEEIPF